MILKQKLECSFWSDLVDEVMVSVLASIEVDHQFDP